MSEISGADRSFVLSGTGERGGGEPRRIRRRILCLAVMYEGKDFPTFIMPPQHISNYAGTELQGAEHHEQSKIETCQNSRKRFHDNEELLVKQFLCCIVAEQFHWWGIKQFPFGDYRPFPLRVVKQGNGAQYHHKTSIDALIPSKK